jgi:hypothetical protein
MSLGGGDPFTSTASCDAAHGARKDAIDLLRSVGIATVVASGNNGFVDALTAPACISSAISVGSTTKTDEVSGFSNAAPFLSLLAPGGSITSSIPGGGFATFSGTSMAAPHVAGAWAVLKSRLPSATVDQILDALRSTGQPIVDSGNGLTFPRIQVDRAVSALAAFSPHVTLDAPMAGAQVASGAPFAVAGWAIDAAAASGTGVDAIHVYAFPAGGSPSFLGVAPYGGSRPDVAGIFGSRFEPSGFTLTAPALAPGSYQIVAYAHSAVTHGFDSWAVSAITVTAPRSTPVASIDAPSPGAIVGPSFVVSGWAVDLASSAGPGVDAIHVYAFPDGGSPIFLGVAAYGFARNDVAAAFGKAAFANSGFSLQAGGLAPGRYTLVVYSRSTVSGTFTSVTQPIVARPPGEPFMSVDAPFSGMTVGSTFHVIGWAIDRDAASGPGVDAIHVWAFPSNGGSPMFVGAAGYGGPRSDVGQAFGAQFTNSAFDLAANDLPAGSYQLVVFARSTVTGTFNQAVSVPIVR